jgi:hypothetical protein
MPLNDLEQSLPGLTLEPKDLINWSVLIVRSPGFSQIFLFRFVSDLGELALEVSYQVVAPENDYTWLVRPR